MRKAAFTVLLIAVTCGSLVAAEIQLVGPWSSAPQWAAPTTVGDVDFRSEGFSPTDDTVGAAPLTKGIATARAGVNRNASIDSAASAGITFSRDFVLAEPTRIRLNATLDGALDVEDMPGAASVDSSAWVTDLATGEPVDGLRIDGEIYVAEYDHVVDAVGSETIHDAEQRIVVLRPGRYKVEGRLIVATSIDQGDGDDRSASDFTFRVSLSVDPYTCPSAGTAGGISCTATDNYIELSYLPVRSECDCTKIVFIQVASTLLDEISVLPSNSCTSGCLAYQDIDTSYDETANRYYTVDYVEGEDDPYYNGDDPEDGGEQGSTSPRIRMATMGDGPMMPNNEFPTGTTLSRDEFETFAFCAEGVDAGTYYTGLSWFYQRTRGSTTSGTSIPVEPLTEPSQAFLDAVASWADLRAPGNLAWFADQAVITLRWTDASHVEDGFLIERRPVGGSWNQVGQVAQGATRFKDAVGPGMTYEYRVRAWSDGRIYMPDGITTTYSEFTLPIQAETRPTETPDNDST